MDGCWAHWPHLITALPFLQVHSVLSTLNKSLNPMCVYGCFLFYELIDFTLSVWLKQFLFVFIFFNTALKQHNGGRVSDGKTFIYCDLTEGMKNSSTQQYFWRNYLSVSLHTRMFPSELSGLCLKVSLYSEFTWLLCLIRCDLWTFPSWQALFLLESLYFLVKWLLMEDCCAAPDTFCFVMRPFLYKTTS